LDLWATAKPFLEDLVKEKYSMKSAIEKLTYSTNCLLKSTHIGTGACPTRFNIGLSNAVIILDLWATAKPFLEDLVKEKYSMKSAIEKLKEKAPELFTFPLIFAHYSVKCNTHFSYPFLESKKHS
jgi:hypothetical protein